MNNDEKDDIGKSVLTCLAAVPIIAVLLIMSMLIRGWAISMLWGWFLVPLGVPAITIAHAIGIGGLAGILCGTRAGSKDKYTTKEGLSVIAWLIFGPLLTVGIGWIVVQFM